MNKNILKNEYFFTFINKISTIVLGLLTTAFINRYAGAALKGEYVVLLNILNIVSVVANLGMYQAYPYYKRKGEADTLKRFVNIFYYQFILYSIVFLIVALLSKSNLTTLIFFMLPFAVLTNQINFIMMVENINYKNSINIIVTFIKFIVAVFTYVFLPKMLIVLVLNLLLYDVLIIVFYLIKLKVGFSLKYISVKFTIAIIKFGFIAMITSLLVNLNYKLDVLMLNNYVSSSLVGIYSVGVTLAEFGWLIPDTFKEVLFSKTAKSDSIQSIIYCLKISFYSIIAAIVLVVSIGKIFIKIMYGNEFLNSYLVTVILFLGIPAMAWFKIISTLYLAQGKRYFYLLTLLASVIANALANLILIPKFSIYGAAMASVISYTVCGGVFLVDFCSEYKINIIEIFKITKKNVTDLKKMIKIK
ncbi:polysaccharide biosynthesis C-terminal domain-containing protein [Romboutsia timonensis]|uniref:polysaccharide biosynthesis C-terminal domain-containing protein n=1 Tax=Romboutsia timonensis TaxID=1776391 RepID=UPI0025CBA031|nr:polysaccharide biosynthesis C-terminal domain-containing protein [uncultured Clostridium sp.]